MEITKEELQKMIDHDHVRNIGGYDIYYISRDDDVISTNYLAKGKIRYLKLADHKGYKSVSLYRNDKNRSLQLVHRLVAQSFIPNPKEHNEVNHKNEIKDDNRVENLEWCSRTYNVNYGERTKKMAKSLCKRVAKTDMAGNILKIYNSTIDTIKDGYYCSHVGACANGNRKTHKGYKWKYL